MNATIVRDGAFTIQNFFSTTESSNMIARAEAIGFAAATINLSGGTQLALGVRNNDRVKFEDTNLAENIWQNLQPFIPSQLEDWKAVRLNERFAVYRYTPGQRFERHQDGVVETIDGEESRFTVLIYLNQDCEGGETIFSEADRSSSRIRFINTKVQPQTGMALVFLQELWHEGAEVLSGVKYVLRTDVMYSKT